ncbi:MAG: FAD binding domain-containing protein, partial [Chloroflexi bacterium]|nr:FAD binding domain-containing protein [Chloroflexota bacterium]
AYYQIESSALVRRRFPMLAEAAGMVADAQVRNKGTLGGSLAHADPAGDMPAVILALGAEIEAQSARAKRRISVDRLNVDLLATSLRPNEILTAIRIPNLPARTGTSYKKFENKASHYAVVGVAAVITVDTKGVCTGARLAITGAGPKPVRGKRAERILIGKELTPAVMRRAASRAGAAIADFNSDVHASGDYRKHLTQVMAERAIAEAASRAR